MKNVFVWTVVCVIEAGAIIVALAYALYEVLDYYIIQRIKKKFKK